MKQISVILAMVFFISDAVSAQTQPPTKNYTVSLTQQQWQGILNSLDSCNKIVQESDVPVRKANFILTSYSALYQAIAGQVGAQLQAEAKAAADTTKRQPSKPVTNKH
jgi:hypothetical protein